MGNSVLERLARHASVMKTLSLPRGRHRLHAMPTSCGYEISSDGYDWDGLKRGQTAFTVLQHTVSGAGHLRYERRRYRVKAGETMLVIVPHNHRYWVEAGGRWEYFWISMYGQEALRIHRTILAATGLVLQLRPETTEQLARCALRYIEGEGETPGAASAIAYEAAMALFDDVFGSHPASEGDETIHRRVVQHILAHLDKPLTVADLADFAGFSRAHFTRIFTENEGVPPAEFVAQERMRRAATLLVSDATISVKDAASLVGFDDPNYFAKAFRRVYGTSPTEFRTTGMYASAKPEPGSG
ncbi:MAG: AraC family transcriptional regulator [Rhizobiales bacterium]|nr:AraC family transcriptional regulator [Hyphomicrobiales bacterium]